MVTASHTIMDGTSRVIFSSDLLQYIAAARLKEPWRAPTLQSTLQSTLARGVRVSVGPVQGAFAFGSWRQAALMALRLASLIGK